MSGREEFAYSQNVITLDFVAVNYLSKRTNYYTYYLEGFEQNWGPKTSLNSQTYTNLSPGQYTFHVRSYKSNGELSPKERTIRLIIHPPFWKSTYAYFIYLLLIIGVLLLYRRFITILNNQKVAVQMARVEKEKSKELNQQKLNFFTFLSNEFKTPITLIMAEIDELIQSNQAWRTDSATNYKVIKKNAKRLQSLIEQITELRKADDEPQKVSRINLDIVTFVKETMQGFAPLLESRQIKKQLSFSTPYLMASFDAGKLEMILGNLFFFFANELTEGHELILDIRVENSTHQPGCELSMNFSFDGQRELFDQLLHSYSVTEENGELFRQSDSASIGMLLTFSLLKMLSGKTAFADDGHRHSLSLVIPIQKSPVSKPAVVLKKHEPLSDHIVDELESIDAPEFMATESLSADKLTLLIADRNRDLAQFLKRHFQDKYRILLAHTYSETQKKAESILPEMIICESDMRDKTQHNLCKSLKDNLLTQAIPVVLLLNDEDDKTIIDALNSGADGYICKPFNLKELDLMISNELKAVSLLKNKLVNSRADPLLHSLPRRNKEQEFVLRFSTLVNQHYKNKEFSTETMAELMSCSRSQLHTKLNTLTGLTPKEYLNDYRLMLARQLLENGNSVAEVAFDVGFGDPNYFSRAFKKKFGVTPSKMN